MKTERDYFAAAEQEQRGPTERGQRHRAGLAIVAIRSGWPDKIALNYSRRLARAECCELGQLAVR